MRPEVFDSIRRTSTAPKGHQESSFDFYNRVDGKYWSAVRDLIQEWSNWLDDGDYADFRGRARSGDDYQFNSVYLELYLHELLRRAGYEVIVHPETKSGRRPDFYASRADGGFYLEAIAPAPSKTLQARGARLARLYDVLDKTNDPRWWLWLERVDIAETSPPAAQLRSAIRTWLASMNPDDHLDVRHRPRYEWEGAGWKVVLSAIPIRNREDGPRRSIGVYPATGGGVDNSSPILQALGRKDRVYGDLARPLIIAVGVSQFDRDRWGARNALWGHELVEFAPGGSSTIVRDSDGYFGVPGGWRRTEVGGVLVVNQLHPSHFLSADVSWWPHPAATDRLPSKMGWPIETIRLMNDGLITEPAPISPQDFFGLPLSWPPGEAFPDAPTHSE